MDRARAWRALNPKIYLVSLAPAFLLAGMLPGSRPVLLLSLALAVALIQHAVNLWNDRSDWIRGADAEKHGSWVIAHGGDLRAVALHGGVSFLLGAIFGLSILFLVDKLWIAALVLPFVGLGLWYNHGLSYTSAGEWVTGIVYGPGVFGGMWLAAGGGLRPGLGIGSTAMACLATAILLAHQPPQIRTDAAAGKRSFAVRHGETTTRLVSKILFSGAGLLALLGVWLR